MPRPDWLSLQHVMAAAHSTPLALADWVELPLFNALVSATDQAAVVVLVSDYVNRRIRYVSPHSAALLGYTPEFFLKGGYEVVFQTVPIDRQPRAIALLQAWHEHLLALTTAQRRASRLNVIRPFVRPDGEEIQIITQTLPLALDPESGQITLAITTISPFAMQHGMSQQPMATMCFVENPDAPVDQQRIVSRRLVDRHQPDPLQLTARELEVVARAAEGLRSRQIADRLGISLQTVSAHRYNILSKTGAQNLTEVVTRAFAEGLL